jgi:solute carrier family 25 phosphate transporter 23/24/25/41
MQSQGTPSHPMVYKSAFDVINKTYEREGLRGFFKGLGPSLAKVLPSVSISYVVFFFLISQGL